MWDLFPVVDFEGMQEDLTGRLQWKPAEFWSATLHDCAVAIQGINKGHRERLRLLSTQATWIINHIPPAAGSIFSKKPFRTVQPSDLYDPDESGRMTKEEADEYREHIKQRLEERGGMRRPPGYFSGGGGGGRRRPPPKVPAEN